MNDGADGSGDLRWQYLVLWRYGGLGLVVVGLAMIAYGASGLPDAPVAVALVTLGFAAMLSGVVLPRIEGRFSAGRRGVSGELVAAHKIDKRNAFIASAPAYVADQDAGTVAEREGIPEPVAVGDVWDALENAGFWVADAAAGKRRLVNGEGRSIMLHGKELVGDRLASADLLAQLAAWGIHPVASGKYRTAMNAGGIYSPPAWPAEH